MKYEEDGLRAAGALVAIGLVASGVLLAGCGGEIAGEAAPAADTSAEQLGAPSFVVHVPRGWTPSMSAWSMSTVHGRFDSADMSYGTIYGPLKDRSVYVCVEALEQTACPSGTPYVFLDEVLGPYRVSISQEREAGVGVDKRLANAWRRAIVDFN